MLVSETISEGFSINLYRVGAVEPFLSHKIEWAWILYLPPSASGSSASWLTGDNYIQHWGHQYWSPPRPASCPLLHNDCTWKGFSVKFLTLVDDTTVVCLINDGDKSAYRQEVEQLAHWCSLNHMELNPPNTVDLTVDFNPPASGE